LPGEVDGVFCAKAGPLFSLKPVPARRATQRATAQNRLMEDGAAMRFRLSMPRPSSRPRRKMLDSLRPGKRCFRLLLARHFAQARTRPANCRNSAARPCAAGAEAFASAHVSAMRIDHDEPTDAGLKPQLWALNRQIPSTVAEWPESARSGKPVRGSGISALTHNRH
jgi:hypothetical protein